MNRGLWLLVSLEFMAVLGNQLLSLAIYCMLVLGVETSAQNLLALFVSVQVTALLMVPIAGPLLERVGPVNVLVYSGIGKAALLGILSVASENGSSVYPLYALAMGLDLFQISGRSSALPLLVRRIDLVKANAVRQKMSVCANILGPAVMGLVITEFGSRPGIAASALLFGVAALGAGWLPLESMKHRQNVRLREGTLHRFREFFRSSPQIKELLRIMLFWMAASGLFQYGFPLWFNEKPSANAFGMGVAFSMFNLGAFGGAVVVFRLGNDRFKSVLRQSLLVEASCILSLALISQGVAFEGGLLLLIGAASAIQQVMLESGLQAGCPPHLLARLMSLGAGLRCFGALIGAMLGALVVHQFGMTSSLLLAAAAFALISFRIGTGATDLPYAGESASNAPSP
ncbi:MAG: MFS transporter [Deltaproteobacteria bacterium]|nr:MFS transporter [Deltaproteobacteria bacterium]